MDNRTFPLRFTNYEMWRKYEKKRMAHNQPEASIIHTNTKGRIEIFIKFSTSIANQPHVVISVQALY